MYQLAAFETVVDILTTQKFNVLEHVVQESIFNTLDKQLPRYLNISVVNHPA